jgi:large subunit ribosomal protein L44e
MSGYRGFPRPKPEGREKTSRRLALKYTCDICKKSHQPPSIRSKKFEIGE